MSYPPKGEMTWNEDKIRLTKHRSLPNVQLRTHFRLVRASDPRGEHASGLMPRVGYTSLIELAHDSPKIQSCNARPSNHLSANIITVTTATPPREALDPRDPLFESTALSTRVTSPPSSVDRSCSSSSPMTVRKSARSIKSSRRNLVIGLDTKKSSLSIDNDHHDIFQQIVSSNPHPDSPASSSKPFSTLSPKLRRRKRLSIARTSTSSTHDPSSVKPIAISLTFSSPATSQILSPKVQISALPDHLSQTGSPSKSIVHRPSSPILTDNPAQVDERRASVSLSSPPSTPSSAAISFSPSPPTNVRLGHPSRPYYSAIRKQGISPPSSRRSSIKDPILSPTRPKSYSPPSLPPASTTATGSSAPRHLSLSAVPHSPFVSAFSLDDDSDDNADEDLPVIPLTPVPVPGRLSFGTSLASVAKSLARKRSMSGPSAFSTANYKPSHSVSSSSPPLVLPLSAARSSLTALQQCNGFRMSSPTRASGTSGIGFSVSGETELKMALAFSEAQTSKNNVDSSGPSFTTPAILEEEDAPCVSTESPPLSASPSPSPISPSSSLQLPIFTNSRHTIANRVKKLKQGLKDMLLMTTHGTGNTNSTTTTTTTPT